MDMETLILTQKEIRTVLTIEECIQAVENVFRMHGLGETTPPIVAGIHGSGGGFHIKAGLLETERSFFVAKINANFPENPAKRKLPTIQGIVLLSDGVNGRPLALMDSSEITVQRTGAATAVAAKYLSKASASTATICGCGLQGRIQLSSLLKVRALSHVYVSDIEFDRARIMADEFSQSLSIEPVPWKDVAAVVKQSDICVTCTPSQEYYLLQEAVSPGTFIAAVGADNESKQELDPRLFAANKIIADIVGQSATIGDLHHALEAKIVTKSDVHAELGEVVAGKKPGRVNDNEIIIFDSTGMALQDAAAAIVVYEKALKTKTGTFFQLNA